MRSQRNLKLYREVPKTNVNHQVNYQKLTQDKNLHFNLRTITMGKLQKDIKEMRAAPSSGMDGLSMNTLKKIVKPLMEPIINLVNMC